MCLGTWRFPSASGGLPPGFYLLREGWVHCPAPEAPLTRGMPKGPRVFLTNSGRVWATALRPVPPKKRPCAIHARKVGRASNTADQSRSAPLQVPGSTSAGSVICGTVWPSVLRYLEISFGLRGPSPKSFTPFGGIRFIARRLRRL